jgi:hypothetical protein
MYIHLLKVYTNNSSSQISFIIFQQWYNKEREVVSMPFKVQLDTNINIAELDLKTCESVIASLEDTYLRTREAVYSYFLGRRSLQLAVILATFSLIFYAMTNAMFFVYAAIVVVVLIMLYSLLMATLTTNMIHKEVRLKIDEVKERIEVLKREKKNERMS